MNLYWTDCNELLRNADFVSALSEASAPATMNAGLEFNPFRNREVSGADVGKRGTRKRILETEGCGCIGSLHTVPQPVADREFVFTNVGTGRGYSASLSLEECRDAWNWRQSSSRG